MNKNPALYIVYLVLPTMIIGIMMGLSYLYLEHSEEFRSTSYIADKQLRERGLYQSALHNMARGYKLELYKRVKPDIVALGSSRVMQFQKESFRAKFLNLGGMASGLIEARLSLQELIPLHKPEIILIGLDFWWFNENLPEAWVTQGQKRALTSLSPSLSYMLEPYYWLASGKISFQNFASRIINQTRPKNTGVAAIEWNTGYNSSGTHYYTSKLQEKKGIQFKEFKTGLVNIEAGKGIYLPVQKIGEQRLEQLESLIQEIKKNNLRVIFLLPPIAPKAYDLFQKQSGLDYATQIKGLLKDTPFEIYDYLNPKTLNTSDCEFIDDTHGGAITYRRILRDLSKRTKTNLSSYLNLDDIQAVIEQDAGYASYPHDGEIDFLDIGCHK